MVGQLPKPYSRPSVAISTEKKEWRTVPVVTLEPGDIVRDLGAVEFITDHPEGYVVGWKNGERTVFNEGDVVFAFVVV